MRRATSRSLAACLCALAGICSGCAHERAALAVPPCPVPSETQIGQMALIAGTDLEIWLSQMASYCEGIEALRGE